MSLLEAMIANHSPKARILSEDHNLQNINWVNGMSDPGEMISCGYLPQLRRLANEADVDYAARIRPLVDALPPAERTKIMAAGIKSAIRRAGYDTSNGKVALVTAGKMPWSALGVHVDQPMGSTQCLELAGQNFEVKKVRLTYEWDGKQCPSDHYGIVRTDTGANLTSRPVGKVYQPIQNTEGFAFLDAVLEQFGAHYDSAGSLYGGKQVFIVAHLPKQTFAVNGTDVQMPYVIFTNPHDGIGRAHCWPTSVRAECANTTRMAAKERSRDRSLAFRHTGSTKAQIAEAQAVLGLAVTRFDEYREKAESLAAKPAKLLPYANSILDEVLDVTQAQAAMGAGKLVDMMALANDKAREEARKTLESKIERRGEILTDILDRYEAEKNGVGGMRGSAWAAYNAITEHVDHNTLGRKVGTNQDQASRRFESVIAGAGDEMKQIALEKALAL